VELTVLGASGTWPPPGGETCGYLLRHEGTAIWLDAGTGTFSRLQQHVGIDEIDAIVITHGHPDHFVDVIPCFYARHYGGMGAPGLPFYSPDGFMELASMLVSENGREVMREAYDFTTVRDGDAFTVGPFSFTTFEMAHIGVHAMGYRIEAGSSVLAYTGDTGPCDAVVEMSQDADLLLAEATYQDANTLFPFHLSASQAAEHAVRAGVRSLLLTHLTPSADPEVSRREAAAVFNGPVGIAHTGMTVEVGG
jgi:Metal-dependent hydrolases of the beta-lactamase superfamily III